VKVGILLLKSRDIGLFSYVYLDKSGKKSTLLRGAAVANMGILTQFIEV